MTLVKICGITNLLDAQVAIDAGADALGFNFYKPSSRYIEPLAAREIIERLPSNVLTVGVFVNEDTPEDVMSIASAASVGAVQLHGDESPEYCAVLTNMHVIKALAVDEQFEVQRALNYRVDAIMLDANNKKLRGGTGHVIDWSVARQVGALGIKLYLAGGLSPENVEEAIATVHPYAVDACSRLEIAQGRKDHYRVRAFVENVRYYDLQDSASDVKP